MQRLVIATETNRRLNTSLIPDEVATTVITLAELNAGVLVARTAEIRAGAFERWTLSLT
jgi:hypothetical protein